MKRRTCSLCIPLLAATFYMPNWTPAFASGKSPYAGIWGIWGGEYMSPAGRPWLKGTIVVRSWSDIETGNNDFHFGTLDYGLNAAVTQGYEHVMVKIYAGFNSPEWLYSAGVPKVVTDGDPNRCEYPYYLDPDFKFYFKRMIGAVAAHIETYPSNIRNRIIGIQCPIGKSGDGDAYHGTPLDPQYKISSSEWYAYQQEMFAAYIDAYTNTSPSIVPLLNHGGLDMHAWLKSHYPRTWRKYSFAAHAYQHHRTWDGRQNTYIPDAIQYHDGWPILVRDEFDCQKAGWFNEAPVWNMYWTVLHALHWGVDLMNVQKGFLEQAGPELVDAFYWFEKYAGCHEPAESPGAWIALRDGLDCADTDRFPESVYGDLIYVTGGDWQGWDGSANPQRYLNIADGFAAYGAVQGDNDVPVGVTASQGFEKMNDVGWKSPPSSFCMYLTQHDPVGTSQGWWRVGPKTQKYGRFARGFNHAKGWDTMWFDLDDAFFTSRPPAGHRIKVRVVYFDRGTGQWRLKYDAVGNAQKTACTVTKTDTGLWKETKVVIEDAYLGNRCPNNTDFMLVSVDAEDDIFHMLEVKRFPVPTEPPAMPSDFEALALGTSRVELSWRDRSETEQNFKIRRSADNLTFDVALIVPEDATSFVDTGLAAGTTYYYKIKAEHSQLGDSSYTAVDGATTADSAAPFTAFNDFSEPLAGGNVTATTRGERGLLRDVESGRRVSALLTLNFGGAGPNAYHGAAPASGTDAASVYSEHVDCRGLLAYAGGIPIELTLSGLSPSLQYEWVLFGNRGEPAYTDRHTTFTLSGADVFRNQSTPGVTVSSQAAPADTTRICNGYNTADGYVARYTGIRPGADGEIRITAWDTTEQFYLNAMMLRATDPSVRVAIPKQATWRYEDTGTDLGTSWRGPSYDDGGWAQGNGILGFGESYINTTVSYGTDPSDKHRTTYFRTRFTLDEPARSVENMALYLRYDDGFVAYLNGTEIVRAAMPAGTVTYAAFGCQHEGTVYESLDLTAHRVLLNPGENTLAIELHQASADSSDLVLDAELVLRIGATSAAPRTRVLKGATWRYRKGSAEASAPATAWRRQDFDDSGWSQGPAPIGYGAGTLGTTLPDMRYTYSSVFLRRRFDVAVHPLLVGELRFDIDYDDGFILWINGSEVARVNAVGVPGSWVAHDAFAAGNMRSNWSAVLTGGELPATLRHGTNVLCAQVFNRALDSSDLLFDCELTVVEGSTLALAEDTDSDGIADGWELATCGGVMACVAAADPDADGFSNLQEYIAGTAPADGASYLAVDVALESGQVKVRCPTSAGYGADRRCYRLEQRDLQDDTVSWTAVPGFERVVGQGATLVHTGGEGYVPYAYRARVWVE